jgi:hypothetical protein
MKRRGFLATLVGLAAVPLPAIVHPAPSVHGYPRSARLNDSYFDTTSGAVWVFTEAGWLLAPTVDASVSRP